MEKWPSEALHSCSTYSCVCYRLLSVFILSMAISHSARLALSGFVHAWFRCACASDIAQATRRLIEHTFKPHPKCPSPPHATTKESRTQISSLAFGLHLSRFTLLTYPQSTNALASLSFLGKCGSPTMNYCADNLFVVRIGGVPSICV